MVNGVIIFSLFSVDIYDIFLPISGLTGTQDRLFVMKNNQCCVGAPLLWIMDPIRYIKLITKQHIHYL